MHSHICVCIQPEPRLVRGCHGVHIKFLNQAATGGHLPVAVGIAQANLPQSRGLEASNILAIPDTWICCLALRWALEMSWPTGHSDPAQGDMDLA